MKSLTAVSAVLPLLLLASGCSKDRNEPRGNGTLNIRLEMDDRIDLVATQALQHQSDSRPGRLYARSHAG